MDQLGEMSSLVKTLKSIVEAGERDMDSKDPGDVKLAQKRTLDNFRWHLRPLFVLAYTEAKASSKSHDGDRVKAAQMLDEELTRLGTLIKRWTRERGPLHYPSEPFKE